MIGEKKKIILWGTGKIYYKNINFLRYLISNETLEVVAITSGKKEGFRYVDGFRYIDYEMITAYDFDYIFIMNKKDTEEILSIAASLGIDEEKLVPFNILRIPGMNLQQYVQLRNERISFFSNNEFGSLLSEKLFWEVNSPFRNVRIDSADMLKLLKEPEFYLERPLRFKGVKEKQNSEEQKKEFLFQLMDVEIRIFDESDPEEVLQDWNCFIQKVNFSYIFPIFTCTDRESEDKFFALDRYEKKLCFVPYDSVHSCSVNVSDEIGRIDYGKMKSLLSDDNCYLDITALLAGKERISRLW